MMESSLTDSMEVCASVSLHMRTHAWICRCNRYTVRGKITMLSPALTQTLKWVMFDSTDIWYLTRLLTQLLDIRWGLQELGSGKKKHGSWNSVSVSLSYRRLKVIRHHLNRDTCPFLCLLRFTMLLGSWADYEKIVPCAQICRKAPPLLGHRSKTHRLYRCLISVVLWLLVIILCPFYVVPGLDMSPRVIFWRWRPGGPLTLWAPGPAHSRPIQ